MSAATAGEWRWRLAAVALATLASLYLAGMLASPAAHAHAVLIGSDPADAAHLDEAPSEILLRFNEPVGLLPHALRVFDASGARVDTGDARYGGERSTLRVGLRADLDDSVYTVTYRVASEDTHPIRGSLSFTVGDPGAVDAVPVTELTGEQDRVGWDVFAAVLRWLTYLGALAAVGFAAFLLLVHDDHPVERDRILRLLRIGGIAAIVATIAGIGAQTAVVSGLGVTALFDQQELAATIGSNVGVSALVRVAGLGLLVLTIGWLWRRWAVAATVVGVLGTLVSFQLSGHTAATEPRALVLGASFAHTSAVAIWFGGLVALALVLRARRQAGLAAVQGAASAAHMVARFSVLATGSVVAVVAAGTALAWSELRGWDALFGTTYGTVLLGKLALVGVILLIGLYNNRWLVPAVRRGAERAWTRLSATVRFEMVVIVAVVAVTAVLVSVVPGRVAIAPGDAHAAHRDNATQHGERTGRHPHSHAGQPHSEVLPLGPEYQVRLDVDPARPGTNTITLQLLDAVGEQAEIAQEVELRLGLPEADIAAISRTPERLGHGRYRYVGPELAIAGAWEIDIRVLVSDFELLTSRTEAPIGTG